MSAGQNRIKMRLNNSNLKNQILINNRGKLRGICGEHKKQILIFASVSRGSIIRYDMPMKEQRSIIEVNM